MRAPRNKHTVTGTYFIQKKPIDVLPWDFLNIKPSPTDLGYLRMAWTNMGMRKSIDSASLVKHLDRPSSGERCYFLDTSFVRSCVDKKVWEAIFRNEVYFTPLVHHEISNWLSAANSNINHASFVRTNIDMSGKRILIKERRDLLEFGFSYYFDLLKIRKLVGLQFYKSFQDREGRPPTILEFTRGFKASKHYYDDRAEMIARKGMNGNEKINYLADEELVISAVLHAITTGKKTTILTRDHDIMEQFYKLICLIDMHYRCMLFAERFAKSPGKYIVFPRLTFDDRYPDNRFIGADDYFVFHDLPTVNPWRALLPLQHTAASMSTFWLGGDDSNMQKAIMTFHGEKELQSILKIKADTNGLNTNLLNGKNCHICPSPDGPDQFLYKTVAITTDRIIPSDQVFPEFRMLDSLSSLCSTEKFNWIAEPISN